MACTKRQTAYPIRPNASNANKNFPNGCCAIAPRAPFVSVVLPPVPNAACTASNPTIAYTIPFAAYPNRASFSTHILPSRSDRPSGRCAERNRNNHTSYLTRAKKQLLVRSPVLLALDLISSDYLFLTKAHIYLSAYYY